MARDRHQAAPHWSRLAPACSAYLRRPRAREREPAGQIAARELELQRITSALRADALHADVVAAIETA